jgi:aminoglycoside 6'-N-acetyltransferase
VVPNVSLDAGGGVRVRQGRRGDAARLAAILAEPEVRRWWREPDPPRKIAPRFRGADGRNLFVIEAEEAVAGGVEYYEVDVPDYRSAGIDVFLGAAWQGRGIGTSVVRRVAEFLFEERGHHRITIDPAAANARAIRCYEKVGFRPVGVMRNYERAEDGTWHDGLLMDVLRDDLR